MGGKRYPYEFKIETVKQVAERLQHSKRYRAIRRHHQQFTQLDKQV